MDKTTYQMRLAQLTPIIKECRSSGMTVKAWCEQNKVNIKTFYYWQRRVRKEVFDGLQESSGTFIQLPAPVPSAEINVPAIILKHGTFTLPRVSPHTIFIHTINRNPFLGEKQICSSSRASFDECYNAFAEYLFHNGSNYSDETINDWIASIKEVYPWQKCYYWNQYMIQLKEMISIGTTIVCLRGFVEKIGRAG